MILPFRILAVLSLAALPVFWTVAAGAQGESEQGEAGASPLLPMPRPEPGAVPSPATKRIRVDETLTLPVPYAPPISGFEAIQAGESELILEARLAKGSPPLTHGVTWRVFASGPRADGTLPLLATSIGGTTSFQLPGGTYYVHAAYGQAGAVKRVDMRGEPRIEPLNLDAGGLRLTAVIGEDKPADSETVTFEIYKDAEEGERIRLVDDADENTVLRLNAGTYHVVSRYGAVNAIVRADIQVNPGKLTEATIRHKGAEVTLKMVEQEGGEALANTQWTVLTPAGDVLHESVGAFPSIILAEGSYTAFARHSDQNYTRDFDVEAGLDRDVEVRLSDLDILSTGIRLSR
jgi:hypothetical protein